MKFSEAEKALKAGKKIKLPKWEKAYWYMNQDGELINHFEGGEELPTIALFPRDMIWVTRDDWEIVHEDEPKNVNEPAGEMKKLRNFGWAIAALKKGKKVARKNWNGKGMFVYLVPTASYPAQTGAAKRFYGEGAMVPYNPYLAIKNVDDTVSTWVPSINDVLANDWIILEND